jgi:hypothetical protein
MLWVVGAILAIAVLGGIGLLLKPYWIAKYRCDFPKL